jgi:hypothetical protein
MGIIVEYIEIWDMLYELQLQPEIDDTHIWRLDNSGQNSSKSAYDSLFLGAAVFGPCERIWESWVPPKCKMFMLHDFPLFQLVSYDQIKLTSVDCI